MLDGPDVVCRAAERLSASAVVGFDTETRPSFRKGVRHPVSLLQLALPDEVYLLRLNQHGLPEEIAAVLLDADIRKVGIGTRDDVRELERDFGCRARNVVSMDRLFRQQGYQVSSLRKLAALITGRRISKRQQTSNWAAKELSAAQKSYAAADAWLCLELWQHLQKTTST